MIELKNISKTYRTGVTALKDINLTIQDGEFCFIVGRSGSGKSTLVRLLTKELDPDYGSIVVNDTDLGKLKRRHIPKYRRRLGVVYQDFRLLSDRTVYENIAFAQLIIGKSNAEIHENVNHIMELTGISSKINSFPRQLSGGEQQRTAIARALVNKPEILIADEPTGNLDHDNALEVMKLLDRINQQGTTVIVITHDRELVSTMKKRTVRMSMGEIVSDTPASGYYYDDDYEDSTGGFYDDYDDSPDESMGSDDTYQEPSGRDQDSYEESLEDEQDPADEQTNDWTDDWDEDWEEPAATENSGTDALPDHTTDAKNDTETDTDTSSSESAANAASPGDNNHSAPGSPKGLRGLKGSHRPHSRKENA